jgi:predicted nucleic acid-binding protein
MELVVDANIMMAVVLGGKNNTTRQKFERLLQKGVLLFAPELLEAEMAEHLPGLVENRLRYAGAGDVDTQEGVAAALETWRILKATLYLVPEGEYQGLQTQALKRLPFDHEDWPYVALALLLECGIWTRNIKHLGASGVPVFNLDTVEALLED